MNRVTTPKLSRQNPDQGAEMVFQLQPRVLGHQWDTAPAYGFAVNVVEALSQHFVLNPAQSAIIGDARLAYLCPRVPVISKILGHASYKEFFSQSKALNPSP